MIRLISDNQEALEKLCRRFRVRRLEVFGSAVRDEFNAQTSDLDFLVEFQDLAATEYADTYFGLLEGLQDLFERKVDLVTISAVTNPYFLRSIDRARKLLYAA